MKPCSRSTTLSGPMARCNRRSTIRRAPPPRQRASFAASARCSAKSGHDPADLDAPTYRIPGAPDPGPIRAPSTGYDQARLADPGRGGPRALQSLIQTLTSQAYQSYTYNVVLRDLDTLAARVEEVKNSIRRGSSRERLQWEVDGLNDQASRIGPQLLAGRPPLFTRLYWSSVESSLQQMTAALG